jgi:hypothetical protein
MEITSRAQQTRIWAAALVISAIALTAQDLARTVASGLSNRPTTLTVHASPERLVIVAGDDEIVLAVGN